MDLVSVLDMGTHFQLVGNAIRMTDEAMTCGNCGADVQINWSPWFIFESSTEEHLREMAVEYLGKTEVLRDEENALYYSEDTDSGECCDRC